jgi:beta-lactamase regulating signal transducer with metallopeptidase domain
MIVWAVDTLIGVSLLMLLVLAVRRPVAEYFGAGWAYALWLLPLSRIFLPQLDFLPQVDLIGSDIAIPRQTVILIPAAEAAAAPSSSPAGSGQWLPLLLALWAGGAAVFISWQQAAYGAFMLSLGREGRRADPPEYGGIPVVESESVDGPMAVGFLRRRIVVPLDFSTRYNPAERRLALEHELVHHRRGDLWWNLGALIVLTANWFNPIAHFAFRAFRADQELACDAAVTRRINQLALHDYARALVKSASRPGQIAACPMYEADQLKRRLKMMKAHRTSIRRNLGGSVALSALLAGGLLVAGPGFAQEEKAPDANILLAERGKPTPIISDAEIATLQQRCGASSVTVQSGARTMMCGNGKVVDDAEVRRIVRDTLKRAEVEVGRAEVQAVKAEKIARSVEQATRQVSRVDVARQAKDAAKAVAEAQAQIKAIHLIDHKTVHKALAQARVQLAAVNVEAVRAVAVAAPPSKIQVRMTRSPMTPEEHADLQRELAEMRAEMHRERKELQQEAGRERQEALREARHARDESLREARLVREQALREAAIARRDALREAEHARREALRAVQEAERQHQQALRDAEQARREAEQARRDAEQAQRDAERAQRDAEQAGSDSEVAN